MADEYTRNIARVAVAQIAEATGFDTVQQSAVDSLADVLLAYLRQLGSASHAYAELAGRTDTNAYDMLLACEDLGMDLAELEQAAQQELPFAHVLGSYPVQCRPPLQPSFEAQAEAAPPHVPSFLPAFPDKRTYESTPVFPSHERSAGKAQRAATSAKMAAEASLVALHRRMSSAATPAAAAVPPSAGNPFLAPPLWEEGSGEPASGAGAQQARGAGQEAGAGLLPPGTVASTFDELTGAAGDAQADGGAGGGAGGQGNVLWTAWRPEAAPSDPAEPRATLSFEWASALRRRAAMLTANKPPENAFEASAIEVAAAPTAVRDARRKRKLTAKAAASLGAEPEAMRAEAILATAASAAAPTASDEAEPQEREVERI